MSNALKQIAYSMIGTLLVGAMVACVLVDWADRKVDQVSRMVDQKIDNITNAPARAATNAWEAVKQAADDIF